MSYTAHSAQCILHSEHCTFSTTQYSTYYIVHYIHIVVHGIRITQCTTHYIVNTTHYAVKCDCIIRVWCTIQTHKWSGVGS